MKEKQLNAKPGMPILIFCVLLYLAAITSVIGGAILLENEKSIGTLPLVLGIIWLIIGFIPFFGLKVLKPNEALVFTLFGEYTGTLRGSGFFCSSFSVAVNPAAKTKLGQSGDVRSVLKASVSQAMVPRLR